jgi:hypothetical protein
MTDSQNFADSPVVGRDAGPADDEGEQVGADRRPGAGKVRRAADAYVS